MNEIIEKSRCYFLKHIENFGKDPYGLRQHVHEANRWAEHVISIEKNINSDAIKIAVWLHDIGHYPIDKSKDHAVTSYEMSRNFLSQNQCQKETMDLALSCIRSHRAKDVMPSKIEEKLFIVIDSVSHMSDSMYINMSIQDRNNDINFRAFEKLERDKRDILTYSPVWNKVSKLYNAWHILLKELENVYEI